MRFPPNDIISLLDVNLTYNLAESTAQDLLLRDLLDEETLSKLSDLKLSYGTSLGQPDLRALLAAKMGVDAEEVLITNGATAAIFLCILSLCEPDDEVVTFTPNFPPTVDIIAAVGARRKLVPVRFENGYRLDLNDLSCSLSQKTRLVILVSPGNPSGVSITREKLEDAYGLITSRCPDAYILVDETYREAVYGTNMPVPSAATLGSRVMVTASLSKCHGAPGLRVGWLSCREPKVLQQLTLAKLNTTISCSVVDEALAIVVLNRESRIFEERRQLLQEGRALVEQWVESNQQFVEWVAPTAGALCCIRLKEESVPDSAVDTFSNYAREFEVQLARGPWFGESNRVFRLGFGYVSLAKLGMALRRLHSALTKIKTR